MSDDDATPVRSNFTPDDLKKIREAQTTAPVCALCGETTPLDQLQAKPGFFMEIDGEHHRWICQQCGRRGGIADD